MRRNLNELEVFVSVAEHKSFTAAGRAVGLSASAVSKYIADLEENLGATLLHRSTHHLVLTDAGTAFYDRCVRVIAEMREARLEVVRINEAIAGPLRIFAPACVGQNLIAPGVAQFLEQHPAVSVELTMYPGTINPLEHRMDIVIRSKKFTRAPASMTHRTLGRVPYVLCAAQRYLDRRGAPAQPDDVKAHNCLIHDKQDLARDWQFRWDGRMVKVPVAGNFVSNSSAAVHTALLRGLGLARLPYYVVRDDLDQGRLVELFTGHVHSDRVVTAYYPRSRSGPAKVRALLDVLGGYCSAQAEIVSRTAQAVDDLKALTRR